MSSYEKKIRRQLTIRTLTPFIVLGIVAIAICGLSATLIVRSLQSDRKEPYVVDLPTTSVSTLVELPGERAFPKSITLGLDGALYSGSFCTGELWRITLEGELEVWLEDGIQAASGMAFAPDGVLYVIDREDCDPRRSVSHIKRVLPDKTVEDWGKTTDDELLNGLAFDDAGVLYATDTHNGHVLAFDENGVEKVWWEAPDSPNAAQPTGIHYDAANHALLVAESNNGVIYRVPIEADGSAGAAESLYRDNTHTLEGLTLDDQGRVIFVSYDESAVRRLESNGYATVLAEDFRNPSEVVFADGRVFVTNFDAISLAPIITWLLDPSLPFTVDVIDLRAEASQP